MPPLSLSKIRGCRFSLILTAVYLFAAVILFDQYRFEIDPDGIAYISIAFKYSVGNIADAVNACWGPLYSWLMLPLFKAGFPALTAVKILGVIIGAITLAVLARLFDLAGVCRQARMFLLLSAIPVILSYAYLLITADLLLLCIILCYVCLVFSPRYGRGGALCGFTGVLAYLAKSYALPFFIVHFSLMNCLHYRRASDETGRKLVLKSCFSGLAVFAAGCALWSGIISYKYGYFTIGTAGRYNFARIGPQSKEVPMLERGHAMLYDGFLDLPNPTAVNAFEDPSYFRRKIWNPLSHFAYYLSILRINTVAGIRIFLGFSVFSFLILAWAIFKLFPAARRPIQPEEPEEEKIFMLKSCMLTLGLWIAGYLLIITEERYLWPANLLLILMSGILFSLSPGYSGFASAVPRRRVLFFTAVLFISSSFTVNPLRNLRLKAGYGRDISWFAEELKDCYGLSGNLASNTHWYLNYYLAYHMGSRYYGAAGSAYNCSGLQKELSERQIDYYLEWDNSPQTHCAFLCDLPSDKKLFLDNVRLEGSRHTLTVYSVGAQREER